VRLQVQDGFQAGGHGFMSTKLGLGADNLLRTFSFILHMSSHSLTLLSPM